MCLLVHGLVALFLTYIHIYIVQMYSISLLRKIPNKLMIYPVLHSFSFN